MAIYELYERERTTCSDTFTPPPASPEKESNEETGRFFSALVSRLTFLALLVITLGWFVGTCLLSLIGAVGQVFTLRKVSLFLSLLKKGLLNLRRSLACSLGLLVGLASPAFGIMVTCTYFLMYDKAGIDEVIPSAFRSQFKDLFHG